MEYNITQIFRTDIGPNRSGESPSIVFGNSTNGTNSLVTSSEDTATHGDRGIVAKPISVGEVIEEATRKTWKDVGL
jgi:hypothetical protein